MHKIVLAVGGTGGHIFPALALGEELSAKYGCDVHFAGGRLKDNPYLKGEACSLHEVSCGKLSKNPFELFKQFYYLIKGVKESVVLLRKLQPEVVIGFGSYYSLPLLIGSKLLGKKVFLHEGNSVPGRVNRLFSPYAERVWVQFPSAKERLKGSAALGNLPLRKNLRRGVVAPAEARKAFQLDPQLITILVIGGSQGAKNLNALFSESVLFHLRELLPPFQVIHSAGSHAETERLMERYVSAQIPAYVRPFIKNMHEAWSAADLCVTRAGAGTIVEQFEFEVPGILIPYPHATDNHQELNADYLESTGLAKKALESSLTPQILSRMIQELYISANHKQAAFRKYKESHHLHHLSEQIIEALKC